MIIPLTDPSLAAVLQRTLSIPARVSAGIECVELRADHSHWCMDVPDWLIARDGAIPAGCLGLLADAALGSACVAAVGARLSLVTTHLHLELLTPLLASHGPLTCIAAPTAIDRRWALSAAEVTTDDGTVVARISMGSVLSERATEQGPAPAPTPAEPMTRALDMTVERDGDLLTARTPAHPWLANSYGGMHGGAGFLIGERTLQHAIGDGMRVHEMRAAYLRPIPADGHTIESTATVAHRGRRLGAARGEVKAPNGKPALLIDATYIPEEN